MTTREYQAVVELGEATVQVALIRRGPRLELDVAKPDTTRSVRGEALIDTGAGHSAIAIEVVRQLGLRKVGETDVQTQGGPISLSVYRVHFYVQELGRLEVFNALGSPWISSLGLTALLGRDALRDAVFTYEGLNGRFVLRLPKR